MRKQNEDLTCPECSGIGQVARKHPEDARLVSLFETCFYCAGTGFATDDGNFEEFWGQK